MGVSAATQPTTNPGYHAKARQILAAAMKLMETTIPLFGADSKEGAEVMKIVSSMAKLSPAQDHHGMMNQMQAAQQKWQQEGDQMKKFAQSAPAPTPAPQPPQMPAAA